MHLSGSAHWSCVSYLAAHMQCRWKGNPFREGLTDVHWATTGLGITKATLILSDTTSGWIRSAPAGLTCMPQLLQEAHWVYGICDFLL